MKNQTLQLKYRYYLKKGSVDYSDVKTILKQLNEIEDDLTYQLSYDKGLIGSEENSTLAWPVWILIIIGLLFGAILCNWMYFRYDPKPPIYNEGKPTRGWLILPAIGLVLSPFSFINDYIELIAEETFSSSSWKILWNESSVDYGRELLILT